MRFTPSFASLPVSLSMMIPPLPLYPYSPSSSQVVAKMHGQEGGGPRGGGRRELPERGLAGEEVLALLRERRDGDKAWRGKCSGTV